MVFSTEIYGDVAIVRLEDELTGDTLPRFQAQLEGPLREGVRNFVIDMEKTEYLDSAGLEAIVDLMDQAHESAGQVKFSGLGNCCQKIFEITRLDRRVDVYETLIDAVRSFR